ncbi:hypothetical protein ACOMHN_006961 [Nucella lapillus]
MAGNENLWRVQRVILLSFIPIALASTVPPYEICSAANFDVRNLTRKMWKFPVPASSCLKPKNAKTTEGDCVVTMAFCTTVNMSNACSQAAVCESFPSVNSTYNLATDQPAKNPFNTAPLISGVGFTTHYDSGEKYTKPDNTTCSLNTVMTFRCNMNAAWDDDKAEDILTVPGSAAPKVQLIQGGGSLCTYNLTFDFAGACPMVSPSTAVSQLSVGSVLLLVFFTSVILYFVLGSFLNVMRGESGQNILPHHEFWTELPGYIRDGMQFTRTCGGSAPSTRTYESI